MTVAVAVAVVVKVVLGAREEEGEDGRGLESARPAATGFAYSTTSTTVLLIELLKCTAAVLYVMHDANMMLAAHSGPGV